MTGYAAASAGSPRGTLSLELRSVNSRFLDLQFRIADELRAHEPLLRELITARVARGKVDCRLSLAADTGQSVSRLNADALARLRELAAAAKNAFPEAAPLRVADLLRWPGVIAEDADEESLRAAVGGLCRRALDDLAAARAREGAKLAAGIVERVRTMRERVERVAPLMPQAIAAYQQKISERLREAIGASDDERIRTEVALFAAKGDVAEELERLRVHLDEVQRILDAGGAVGKRLDFIAQELNREANTLAAKALSQAISDCALELKLLVEQVREQVQNIEVKGRAGKGAGTLFVITAPSGAGKTSLIEALTRDDPSLKLSISYTTRAPRPGEKNGVDYHFVDDAAFLAMRTRGEFLESAEVHGYRYGTSKKVITEALKRGEDLILEIDWQGAQQVRRIYPDCVGIFILPPSIEELERRMRARGQDSDAVIRRRLENAKEELEHSGEFEYRIINKDFDTAQHELAEIIRKERSRSHGPHHR